VRKSQHTTQFAYERDTKLVREDGEGKQLYSKSTIQIFISFKNTLTEKSKIMFDQMILFSWAPKSLQMVTAAMKLKDTCSLEGKL